MSQVNEQTLYDHDLTQWLQISGEHIARIRPAEERVPWVLFLLDQVKPFLTPEEYSSYLAELQQAIADRRAKA